LGAPGAPIAAFGDQHPALVIEGHHGRGGQPFNGNVGYETVGYGEISRPDRPLPQTGSKYDRHDQQDSNPNISFV
jgi:hypothetical protein